MSEYDQQRGRFARMRGRIAQALLREPAVILLERDADPILPPPEPSERSALCHDTRLG